ncbi:MAG TPA: SAM-dependent methyltransferase [Streptosporangiaceae bacterium]
MTETGLVPDGVETGRPSVARLYDFFLGGHHNFAADRELARKMIEAEPNARYILRENRRFLGRAVSFLINAGVRQFIDLGSGIPTQENVHEIAQRGSADARVVYVDNDPVAVAHSRQILSGNSLATVIEADLRNPGAVLDHPDTTRLIDFSQPVGLLMIAVLHFVPDSDDPAGLVGTFAQRLASGSYLAISHATQEAAPSTAAQVQDLYKSSSAAAYTRTHAEIMRFFAGFEMVDPGLVYLPQWRPEGDLPEHPERAWFYAGVGRKP